MSTAPISSFQPAQTPSSHKDPTPKLQPGTVASALSATRARAKEKITAERAFEVLTGSPLKEESVPLMEALIYDFFEEVETIHKQKISNLSFDYIDTLLEEIQSRAPKNMHAILSQALKIGKERHNCKLTLHLEHRLEKCKPALFQSSQKLGLPVSEEPKAATWKKVLIGAAGAISLFVLATAAARLFTPQPRPLIPCQPRCEISRHDPFIESVPIVKQPAEQQPMPVPEELPMQSEPMVSLSFCKGDDCDKIRVPERLMEELIPKEGSTTSFFNDLISSQPAKPLSIAPPLQNGREPAIGNATLSDPTHFKSALTLQNPLYYEPQKVRKILEDPNAKNFILSLQQESNERLATVLKVSEEASNKAHEAIKLAVDTHDANINLVNDNIKLIQNNKELAKTYRELYSTCEDLLIQKGAQVDRLIANLQTCVQKVEFFDFKYTFLWLHFIRGAAIGMPLHELFDAGNFEYHLSPILPNLYWRLKSIIPLFSPFLFAGQFHPGGEYSFQIAMLAGIVHGMVMNSKLFPFRRCWEKLKEERLVLDNGKPYIRYHLLSTCERALCVLMTIAVSLGLFVALQRYEYKKLTIPCS